MKDAAADLARTISVEIARLEAEATQLKREIDELADSVGSAMVA